MGNEDFMNDVDKIIANLVPRYRDKDGKPKPAQEYYLVYDSSSETLEPIYFWLLDWLDRRSTSVEKLIDNFASSPGSGHFGEMQGRASQMQQEASRVLGTVNNILKGIINLIYDLKEFKIRLSHYDAANSKDKEKAQAGLLALKQIWMDKVDMLRGQGSLNALSSGNLQFVTLRDAFMVVNSPEDVEKLDLNDRVKRVLKPRVQEFFEWKLRSEQELKKRYEIERLYLKSQVDALQLNARWARPYLRAAEQLKGNENLLRNPGVVMAFNTIILELSIMSINKNNIPNAVANKELPEDFLKIRNLKKMNSIVLVDFLFRGIPGKQGQHYTFGGKADVYYRAYALSDEELVVLRDKLRKNDVNNALGLIEGMTTDSLAQINADIEEFLPDKDKKEEKKSKGFFDGFFSSKPKKDPKKEKEEKEKKIIDEFNEKGKFKADSFADQYVRNYAEASAMNLCFEAYDKYKKAHGMLTFPYGGSDNEAEAPRTSAEDFFGLPQ